eukprot:PhM_4_TR2093/c1_g3_i1/m.20552
MRRCALLFSANKVQKRAATAAGTAALSNTATSLSSTARRSSPKRSTQIKTTSAKLAKRNEKTVSKATAILKKQSAAHMTRATQSLSKTVTKAAQQKQTSKKLTTKAQETEAQRKIHNNNNNNAKSTNKKQKKAAAASSSTATATATTTLATYSGVAEALWSGKSAFTAPYAQTVSSGGNPYEHYLKRELVPGLSRHNADGLWALRSDLTIEKGQTISAAAMSPSKDSHAGRCVKHAPLVVAGPLSYTETLGGAMASLIRKEAEYVLEASYDSNGRFQLNKRSDALLSQMERAADTYAQHPSAHSEVDADAYVAAAVRKGAPVDGQPLTAASAHPRVPYSTRVVSFEVVRGRSEAKRKFQKLVATAQCLERAAPSIPTLCAGGDSVDVATTHVLVFRTDAEGFARGVRDIATALSRAEHHHTDRATQLKHKARQPEMPHIFFVHVPFSNVVTSVVITRDLAQRLLDDSVALSGGRDNDDTSKERDVLNKSDALREASLALARQLEGMCGVCVVLALTLWLIVMRERYAAVIIAEEAQKKKMEAASAV